MYEELRQLRRDARDVAAHKEALERQYGAEVAELKRVHGPYPTGSAE